MLILALIVIATLLLWIGMSANSIVVNSAIAATEATNLRGAVAELTAKLEALERQLDHLTQTTDGLDDVITLVAYWLSQRPEFFDLEPDYLREKDLSDEELNLRSHARVALRSLSHR